MKVLVTGAAGFIGSALSLRLLDRGDEVIGIDNHNDYYDPALKEARLARHADHPNYTHIRMNIEDREGMDALFEGPKFEGVVNLAAQAGVRYSIENPLTYIDDIVEGIIRVLDRPAPSKPNWDSNNPDPATASAPYRVYNIGNNNPVELMDYIEALEASLGKVARKKLLPLQPGDVPDTYADVDDLVSEFGYKPSMPVRQGVEKFTLWYKEYNL